MEKKWLKIYLTYYSLLITQALWKAHYQILSKTFLNKYIELNVNPEIMITNVERVELNISITTAF